MFSFINKKVKVAVHNGKFHPDDVFAVAILSLYLKKPIKIFRTRDAKVISKMDYVCDVGGVYNPREKKFDHHQEGWDEKRKNGILYATSGLVWKEYGEKICGSPDVAKKIEDNIIQTIDAEDNGEELYKNNFEGVIPYTFADYIFSFNDTWKENTDSTIIFEFAVCEAKKMLSREIKRAKDNLEAAKIVRKEYEESKDKRLLILDRDYSWRKAVLNFPELVIVVHPRFDDKTWSVSTVGKPNSKFERKIYFPKSWAGKRDGELAKITGVKDAVFCHNDLFVAVAKSKEGAIALANLALEK